MTASCKRFRTWGSTLALWTALSITGFAADPPERGETASPEDISRLGLTARAKPGQRDSAIQELAHQIQALAGQDRARLRERQRPYQEALLLLCDRGVFETISAESVEAIDNALEAAFTLDDLCHGTEWDRLSYVYGFFNHDVTRDTIKQVADGWYAIPEDRLESAYPPYVHAIDAVCKPLAMAGLSTPEETRAALEIAVPLLKSMLLQHPKPGRAFHPPSHASLVLGPLYERWNESEENGAMIREQLGSKDEFVEMMAGQLVGSLPDRMDLEKYEYGFYAYTGRYIANALARLNARQAVPALRASLDTYEAKNSDSRTMAYTRRALIALGDKTERATFEAARATDKDATLDMAVWLSRNGQGETAEYGNRLLAELLDCNPARALDVYFERELEELTRE